MLKVVGPQEVQRKVFGTKQVAEYLGVSQQTVIYWCKIGVLSHLTHVVHQPYEILPESILELDMKIRKALKDKPEAVRSQWLRISKKL